MSLGWGRLAGWGILAAALAAVPAAAIFVPVTTPAPVDRLVRNVGEYVKEHPKDAVAHYTLGRIHSLAYAVEGAEVPIAPPRGAPGLPAFGPTQSIQIAPDHRRSRLTPEQQAHLLASIREYRRATELDPKTALYFLGLGWMQEQAYLASQAGNPVPGEPAGRSSWNEAALNAYRSAYRLARERDLAASYFGPAADSSIASEAGDGLVRMLATRKMTDGERTEQTQVQETLAKLRTKSRAVTPVIFPLGRARRLAELLPKGRTTTFDLAGDDVRRRWPWVSGETGILTWDPEQSGRIRSGQQLFGSATWWIFWRNGYEPLAALDDDGDGRLTGRELSGIAVWQDRNGNGSSEPGEVRPLGEFDIDAISVHPDEFSEGVPANSHGIRLRGGGFLPTYDWTASPVLATSPSP